MAHDLNSAGLARASVTLNNITTGVKEVEYGTVRGICACGISRSHVYQDLPYLAKGHMKSRLGQMLYRSFPWMTCNCTYTCLNFPTFTCSCPASPQERFHSTLLFLSLESRSYFKLELIFVKLSSKAIPITITKVSVYKERSRNSTFHLPNHRGHTQKSCNDTSRKRSL